MAVKAGGTNKRSGDCAYCGKTNVIVEEEHVFPESWYPDGYPPSKMLVVPSCRPCNQAYNRVEVRMLPSLILSVTQADDDPPIDSVIQRFARSLDAMQGKSVTDIFHRNARKAKIMRSTNVLGAGEEVSGTPGWHPAGRIDGPVETLAGLQVYGAPIIKFNADDANALIVKFMKGTFFALTGCSLPPSVTITPVTFVKDPRPALASIERLPNYAVHGDWPFEYGGVIVPGEPPKVAFSFRLWGFHLYFAYAGFTLPAKA
ncbi:MAG TPA: hypothetical protein VFP84_31235 [Kofleriaceae bacterium]|nr:hypothetical protein [Kofleriaceae bacterium]